MSAVVNPQATAEQNGAGADGKIAVENPATAEVIAYVDDLARCGILDGDLPRLVAIRRSRLRGSLFLGTGHREPSPS